MQADASSSFAAILSQGFFNSCCKVFEEFCLSLGQEHRIVFIFYYW